MQVINDEKPEDISIVTTMLDDSALQSVTVNRDRGNPVTQKANKIIAQEHKKSQ